MITNGLMITWPFSNTCCKTAVAHGGWVAVESTPGLGSTFTITLPTINTAIGKTFFQPQSVDTIAMGFDVFMYLLNKIQPLTRFTSEDAPMAKLGFKAVMHAGVEYVADNLCPTGSMFGFDSDILHLWVSRRALGRFGFTGFKTDQVTVGDVLGQVVFFGAMTYPVPRVGFRFYNLNA